MQVDEQMQNNEIFLTHRLEIIERRDKSKAADRASKDSGAAQAITGMSYLATHHLLALTFSSGKTLLGRIDMQGFNSLSDCVVIPSMASLSTKQATAKSLLASGEAFHNFTEIPHMMADQPNSLSLMASLSKQGSSVPCVIEVRADKIKIEVVKSKTTSLSNRLPAVHGCAFIKPSFRKTWRKAPRVLTVDETGTSYVFKVADNGGEEAKKANHGFMQELNAQRKILKTDLPRQVNVPANFFEKQRNIWQDQAVYKNLAVTGTFAQLMKSKVHRLFDNKIGDNQGYADDRDKETTLKLALNQRKTDNLIVGLRIKLGGSQRSQQVTFKVFEREPVPVAQGDSFWYDVGFSDVEAIYGSQNSCDIVLTTTNAKSCPIKIHKIELFIATHAEFQLHEKLARHLKELYRQIESKQASKTAANTSAAIKRELL